MRGGNRRGGSIFAGGGGGVKQLRRQKMGKRGRRHEREANGSFCMAVETTQTRRDGRGGKGEGGGGCSAGVAACFVDVDIYAYLAFTPSLLWIENEDSRCLLLVEGEGSR